MRVGTRSLLFGVHQVIWHPVTVALAWRSLYGAWPSWREAMCIIIHDWGYWGAPNMDGEEGERHPVWAARVAGRWLGPAYADLCLLHSRHYARQLDRPPSLLCWPDKLSLLFDPPWFYLFRARFSGELWEYRQKASEAGVVPLSATDWEWLMVIRARFQALAHARRGDVVSYSHPLKGGNDL